MKNLPKTPEELKIMQTGGAKLAAVLRSLEPHLQPGVSTLELDRYLHEGIIKEKAQLSFTTVRNYHHASCICLNDEVVHGIPKADKIIKEGDLVKVDVGLVWEGLHADLAWTYYIGSPSVEINRFLAAGQQALAAGIAQATVGHRVGDISQSTETTIRQAGYFPTPELTGHGVGRHLHEDPLIPNVLTQAIDRTPPLVAGMTIAVEVIYNFTDTGLVIENDGWTIATRDGRISALFENTIAVTNEGPLILTTYPERD